MANAPRPTSRITASEYLAGEEQASLRHEFVDGLVYAMAGTTLRHNTVKLNVAGSIHAMLGEPCRAFDGDVKLRVRPQAEERYYYPDVMVTCGAQASTEHVVDGAVLVVEVLSPSTERIDRFEKFAAYVAIPELLEYVLVDQDKPTVEVFRRRTNWQRETFGPGDTVAFESIGHTMTVEEIYRRALD